MTDKAAEGGEYRIEVEENGPYVIRGAPPLHVETITTDADGGSRGLEQGASFPLRDRARLCRCGQSQDKPYCDGSHKTAGVDLQETASFAPIADAAERIPGDEMVLSDNESLCAYGRFCDVEQSVWREVSIPGKDHEELTKSMVRHCPGGRLELWDKANGDSLEEPLAPGLSLIEDPSLGGLSGPLRATGGIPVVSASGKTYEVRNRQALCRCGASAHKPFCDGSHASVGFKDGLTDSDGSGEES